MSDLTALSVWWDGTAGLDSSCGWQVIRMVGESNETVAAGGVSGTGSNKMPTLDEYGNNLTQQAREVRMHALQLAVLCSVGRHSAFRAGARLDIAAAMASAAAIHLVLSNID